MKKKLFLLSLSAASVLALGITMINVSSSNGLSGDFESHYHTAPVGDYTLSFDPQNLPAGLTGEYQNSFAGSIKTNNGNEINMTYVNVKLTQAGVQVANHGKVYNFGSGNTKISGINGIAFTGSGSFIFRPVLSDGSGKGYVVKENAVVVNAGGAKVAVPECDYFELEAGDSGAVLQGLSISYSCSPDTADIKLLDGTYTGVGSDASTYKLVVSNGSVSIQSLDKEHNLSLSGTYVMLDKDTAKCTFLFNTYNIYYVMDFDGHSFTFVSKSDDVGGAAAAAVAEVNFDRVYNVEDFESYSATGQGYTSSTKKYETTGLRANYYADFYTTGTGEIGGNNWPVMTSTDNSNWRNNKGRNASAGGIFKFSNGMDMRYISMNELYGVKSIIGAGAKLSFWVRGAYTNTNFNADATADTPMKFYAYYGSPLTPSTQSSVRETFEFTVKKGSEWQHFEMPLTAGRPYYGFGIYAKQSSGATQYVPFDDIQIYTASPYAEYIPPVAVTGVTLSDTELNLITGGAKQLTATVTPDNATNKNVTWSSNATSVATVDADGTVHAVAPGEATITATTQDGGFTATCAVTVANPALNYPEGTYKFTASVYGVNADVILAFGNQANGLIAVRISNTDMIPGAVAYNSDTKVFSIPTTGTVTFSQQLKDLTAGTITGTFDSDNNRLVNVNCDGQLSAAVSDATFVRPSGHYYDCDGTTEQLRTVFKRRHGNNWDVNPERILSNTTEYVSGEGSMTVMGWNGGRIALNFKNDFNPAVNIINIQFWVYNPSGTDRTLRMWYYLSAGFTNNGETGSVTAKAGQWTYVAMGFGGQKGSSLVYNFQIADFSNSGTNLSYDNIYLF